MAMATMTMPTVRVFGKPITDGTRYQRSVTALNNMYEGASYADMVQATNDSKKGAATATVSTTIGRIYNATGEEVKRVTAKDWNGKVVREYPVSIKNGQWAVFLHVGTQGKDRQSSVAAVVYEITDVAEMMVAWNNPWKSLQAGKNSAYCEMKNTGCYDDKSDWEAIKQKLLKSETEKRASMQGYETIVKIEEGGNAPIYTAIFSVET